MVDHMYSHHHRSNFFSNRNDRRPNTPNGYQTLNTDPPVACGHDMVRGVLSALLRPFDGIHRAAEFEGGRCARGCNR